MKMRLGLLLTFAIGFGVFGASALAKTAKECTAEWRADKAGMQARGMTEKAYVEQCKGGEGPTATAPTAKPADACVETDNSGRLENRKGVQSGMAS